MACHRYSDGVPVPGFVQSSAGFPVTVRVSMPIAINRRSARSAVLCDFSSASPIVKPVIFTATPSSAPARSRMIL